MRVGAEIGPGRACRQIGPTKMTDHLTASTIAAAFVSLLLGFAAWRDLATRTIPDAVSLGAAAAGLCLRGLDGGQAVLVSTAAALFLFAAMLPLNARGMLGGADLKLLTALSLGLAPLATLHLLMIVSLFGAALAATYVALGALFRRLPTRPAHASRNRFTLLRLAAVERYRIRKSFPLPYGVAIAAGGVFFAVAQSGV